MQCWLIWLKIFVDPNLPGCDDDLVLAKPNERRNPGVRAEGDDGKLCEGVSSTLLYLPLGVDSVWGPFWDPGEGSEFVLLNIIH